MYKYSIFSLLSQAAKPAQTTSMVANAFAGTSSFEISSGVPMPQMFTKSQTQIASKIHAASLVSTWTAAILLSAGFLTNVALADEAPESASAPSVRGSHITTSQQKAVAQQVAQTGIPISELAPNAPDSYTVKRGDTLWAISGLFLTSPWRWPELWGMNQDDIKNPHLIYPGQILFLTKKDGMARLSTGRLISGNDSSNDVLHLSPKTRYEKLSNSALPTVNMSLLEPFLVEPLIVEPNEFQSAPRIVAADQGRTLLGRGDRAYARSSHGRASLVLRQNRPSEYRIFREATPIKDPNNGEILGYEARFVGRATLKRSESMRPHQHQLEDGVEVVNTRPLPQATEQKPDGPPLPENNMDKVWRNPYIGDPLPKATEQPPRDYGLAEKFRNVDIVPATLDIISVKEEIHVGDRLLPEPQRELMNFAPRAPNLRLDRGRIASVYGSAVFNAGQNQVVTLNLGRKDGVEPGHVMAILSYGGYVVDKTNNESERIRLPDERNGLLMVFKTFERVSYALVLEIKNPVRIGDRIVHPR